MQQAGAAPRNVSGAVVVKNGDIFFLSQHSGEVPHGNTDGFGLYYHDCRYLSGYEIRLAGTPPNALVSTAARGSIADFVLTNEKLQTGGHQTVPEQTFGITIERILDRERLTVHDLFTIEDYDIADHDCPIALQFHSDFDSIFEIRGLHPKKVGRAEEPEWQDDALMLRYDGADGVNRRVHIHFDPKPDKTSAAGAEFGLKLKAGERLQIKVSLQIVESREQPGRPQRVPQKAREVAGAIDRGAQDWLAKYAEVHSDDAQLNAAMGRSLLDLGILESSLDQLRYFSAGLPWYGALFGRDSITAALQTLAFEPGIAEQTIRLLAKYQGTKSDDWRDEEPGKILHELRRGELANLNEIPQTPYYGSVDATPLFLILVGEHANWTGDLSLFRDVRGNVERALGWIDGSSINKGYLSYASKSSKGLGNQGWKDSGDSIMNADGSLAVPPIALVEVQGYVYRAKELIAELYARSGDGGAAARLRQEASDLKSRFNRDFWMEDKNFYAIALQKGGRPADVVSSNPGQALWTGILDDLHVRAVAAHLTAEDMFSGWGIRTLSQKEKRYNPIGYHLGTVWPHDNSFIAAGFKRHGFDREAADVLDGIVKASVHFQHHRLPEVFAGFSKKRYQTPVRYPVACHPQAWAAGAIPLMITALLGITADGFNGRLRVERPTLPNGVASLEFRRIKIGRSAVDLRFRRAADGIVKAEVANQTGDVRVEVDSRSEPRAA